MGFYDIIKFVVSLIIIVCLMGVTFKYLGKGMKVTTGGKYIKIIEKTQLSKDSFIVVLRIGNEGMVMLTSSGHTEKLKDITKEEIEEIESKKQQSLDEMSKVYEKILSSSKEKVNLLMSKIKLKEDRDEEEK
ncbi:MAG: flagellar biosynthetic protein FliO [Clostridium sp.]|uniref:flagellar biosynthetic protein FliO n=1 Tax=Clostridium sp. DSM 8431 TaxID=1761781 RepID=UPI0008EF708B|nr:flagellar biosynthetic protein FliO [Clostridium sp. DSM 8431]MCR4944395.1 flagellar biosynthetic protein FliO [Clostridium sp.]SFU30987.1 flagellar protein FliO/FliZ [Clostridium sp. DSM 8431]